MTTRRAILDHLARTRRTTVVALAAGAAGLALGAPAPAGAAVKRSAARPLVTIVAPRSERTLAARPFVVRVRAGAHAGALRVRLNGRPIHQHFGPPRRGLRGLRISASHGLRHGFNTLRVTVRASGRRPRTVVRRFRIAATHPLAAAGVDRALAHGGRIRLDAGDTRLHPAARRAARRAGASATTRYRWSVVAAPRGSGLRRGRVVARTMAALLRLRRPGTYRLRLAVTAADGRVGADRTTVRVDPRPLLALDTMAVQDDRPGIRVGDAFYPADAGAWLQVVVLDRSLGTLRGNTSYRCADRTAAASTWQPCAARVAADLAKLDATSFVIASAQPDGGGTASAPHGAHAALARIGVPQADELPSKGDDLLRGTWSALGAIGNKDRATVRHPATTNVLGGGRISGWLVRNNRLHYTYVSPERLGFATQADGSSATQNVIEVAGSRYAETGVGDSPGGFHVVVVDTRTLAGRSHWFATGGARGQVAIDTLVWLRRMLADANDDGRKLIFVVSRGMTAIPADAYQGLARSHQLYHALMGVADEFQRAGGTRGAIFDMIDPELFAANGSQSLTFAGHSQAGAGWGEIARAPGKAAQGSLNGAPLEGTLTRSESDYAFAVERPEDGRPSTTSLPDPGEQLRQVVYQDPAPWPEEGNQRREVAMRWVGVKLLGTDDPRGQYWTQEYSEQFWDGKLRELAASGFFSDLPRSVDEAAARWAAQQLATEIGWLQQTAGFLTTLARPYAQLGMTSWADLGKIADDIQNKVGEGANQRANLIASGIFDLVRTAAVLLPEVGEVAESLNAVYEIGMGIGELATGEAADEPFSSSVADAQRELAARLDAAQSTLERQIFHVIAADYGKLSTVGLCSANSRPCPTIGRWQVTSDFTVNATKALRGSLKTSFYAALLPAKYGLWQGPYYSRDRDANKLMGFGVLNFPVKVFDGLSGLAQHARPVCRDMGDHDRDAWDVYALAQRTGNGTVFGDGPWVMHPPADAVVRDLFSGVDRTQFPAGGGLGADQETFFSRYFKSQRLEHFMYTTGQPVEWPSPRSDCDITE